MEQKIADWYSEAGIVLTDSEKYDVRLEGIKAFIDEGIDMELFGELSDNFMGGPLKTDNMKQLIDSINEKDRTFTSRSEKEIRILSGMCLKEFYEQYEEHSIPIMMKLLATRGCAPSVREIYDTCIEQLDCLRLSCRKENSLDITGIPTVKKLADKQKITWDGTTSTLVMGEIEALAQHIVNLNRNIKKLNDMLKTKSEETDILWWLLPKWSELYDKKISDLSDCQAAIAVPLELATKTKYSVGPISIFSVMKSALEVKRSGNKHLLEEYVTEASNEILECVNRYKLGKIQKYFPVLLALQNREFEKDFWKGIIKKECGITAGDMSYTVEEMAEEVYYECELYKNIHAEEE